MPMDWGRIRFDRRDKMRKSRTLYGLSSLQPMVLGAQEGRRISLKTGRMSQLQRQKGAGQWHR